MLRPDPGAPLPGPLDGAAAVTVWRNPLDPQDRVTVAAPVGDLLIDWLRRHYPSGFGRPIKILWNGLPLDIEHSDRAMGSGDVIGIFVTPGEPASITFGALLINALIGAAITIAATLAINLIFGKPKRPGETPKPDPVYSLSGAANGPRLGEPIPAIYGKVITTPDWAAQPYAYFENNDQFQAQILCLGMGRFQISDVILGDTPVAALVDAGAVTYQFFDDSQHARTMGNIEAATGIMENVITAAEVADQELTGIADPAGGAFFTWMLHFTPPSTITITSLPIPASIPAGAFTLSSVIGSGAPNDGQTFTVASYNPSTGAITVAETTVFSQGDEAFNVTFLGTQPAITAGPFVVGKPGVRGNRLMLDIVFPGGLYHLSSKGKLQGETVTIDIVIQPIDDAGANAGAAIAKHEVISRASNTPVRLTFSYDVPVGRYTVKMTRTSGPASDTQTVNSFTWTALKFRLINTTGPVYGNATLLAIKIRATNGIADGAASRVRVACTRWLPPLGSGSMVVTRDPADAFADIYCNADYGARRPLGELDTATLAALKSHWAGRARFDAVFNQKSTIWEALGFALQTAGAAPLPDGPKMSAVQDGVKALRTQFFSDANMVRGSLQIGYQFDKPGAYDGFSVEYRDPATFAAQHAIYPPGALDLEQATLFGCTDPVIAGQYARLLWQRRLLQRKTAQFDSELEGLIPRFADRVAIASRLPRWGQTGVLAAFSGLLIRVDQPLDWSGAGQVMVLRSATGTPSGLIVVTRGGDDDEALLAADPGFPLSDGYGQEPTHYSFGTSATVVRDFIVSNLAHQGGVATQISAMVYDPAIYAGAMPWMVEPI